MNKVAHYLQQHLTGEILTSPDVLEHFSTDESILSVKPILVAHPRNEQDIRKTARFSWQLAERGKIIPITIRGKGRDQTGASLGDGIVLSTTAHMNKIIQLDPKSGDVTVQVGANAGKLQQTLYTHGRYIPSFPVDDERVTVGGIIGNNDLVGEAYAYGPISELTHKLRVVLANGEIIETGRLSKRELNKKLGLASFEGEVYRSLDSLIEENSDLIESIRSSENGFAGYSIAEVKLSDGSFDLTPLFVGAQGTLGLVTEATLLARQHDPKREMVVAFFDDASHAFAAVDEINSLKKTPLSVDFLDESVVDYAKKTNPSVLKSTFGNSTPAITLFITYNEGDNMGKRDVKKMHKILEKLTDDVVITDDENFEQWQAASHLAGLFLAHSENDLRPLPVIPGATIPVGALSDFLLKAKDLIATVTGRPAILYGQAGLGVVHAVPLFNVSQLGDRQKVFKLIDAYYSLVAEYRGTIAGAVKSGRLLNAQLPKFMSEEQLALMKKIKKVFDPYSMLNPGVMQQTHQDTLKPLLREHYTIIDQHSFFPRGK